MYSLTILLDRMAYDSRRRHRLTAVPIVAAGLGFAMHNNQSEAEAAQWRRQRGILRVDAVPRDTH